MRRISAFGEGPYPFRVTHISANSVLPARRHPVSLLTEDGVRLVAEWALPQDDDPRAVIVFAHPLPTHGGSMDSHLIRKAAWRLPALAGIGVLRFNTRGTASAACTSQGVFDHGDGERYDVAAALEYAEFEHLPAPWLLGWSFGTDLALMHGLDPLIRGAILLSPPLRFTTPDELAAWDRSPRPLVCLVPEFDDYLVPDEARRRFAIMPTAEIRGVEGAKHLWVGERHVSNLLRLITERVAPDRAPLPTSWDGPMERWSDL